MSTPFRDDETTALLAQLLHRLTQPPQPAPTPAPDPDRGRVLFTVEEAARKLGIGKTLAWQLVGAGELESVRIGRLRRVHTDAIAAYARRLVAEQNHRDIAA